MSEESNFIKVFSLFSLMIQNVSLVLLMRFVRIRSGAMFSSSTAVVCSEIIKLITCLIILFIQQNFKIIKLINHLRENLISDFKDFLLIMVPAVLYVCQNNLLFVAVSNLDTASFQVCYQLKLLTTAVFFRIILKRSQSLIQWLSLLLLFGGIVIVQLQQVHEKQTSVEQSRFLGFIAVVIASLMSGFSGIFFEKILKETPKNVWIRNIQLSFYGILFGLLTVFIYEGKYIYANGFFFGYDLLVWIVICIQSLGGILVAIVMKYANNILKGFATSGAIVLAAIISIPLFNFSPNIKFIIASSMVITSSIIYTYFPYKDKSQKENEVFPLKITIN